ncbi:hypothetical protein [Lysobacter antibioticus]|uniref:hypothetical protein n=1 Tax=Lysobacter antibioticus TaxID=84531 RepID=UPI00113FD7AB|nr:hypothetical protein [Lysobacter antibioticus]
MSPSQINQASDLANRLRVQFCTAEADNLLALTHSDLGHLLGLWASIASELCEVIDGDSYQVPTEEKQ